MGCDLFNHTQGIITAAVQDDHELKPAAVIVSEVSAKLAQHRFDPRLFVVSGDKEQQAGFRHEGLLNTQLALNAEFFDALAQSGAGDAEELGGMDLVATGLFERLDDQFALDRGDDFQFWVAPSPLK